MSSDVAGSKRSNDGGNWGGAKRARANETSLRFLLNSKHAGGIIGKGGETIKRLRSDYSAHITVPDTDTGERVLTISANKEACINVLKECLPLVHEAPYRVGRPGSGEENEFEIDFLVLSGQVGGIIGKGGERIKQIREESKAKIKVYQDCLPDSSERVVALGGSEDEIVGALQNILGILENEPLKGGSTLYDPSYVHQTGFDNYNSYSGPPGRGRGMSRGGGGRGRGGPRNDFGGHQGYGGGGFGQDFNNSHDQGFGGGFDKFGGGYGPNSNFSNDGWNSGNSFGSSESTQVTVTNDMAGAIIGRGGERIRGIRQKSGADIKFADSEKDNKERLVTIKGSREQIQHAQYLMQQCVREHTRE